MNVIDANTQAYVERINGCRTQKEAAQVYADMLRDDVPRDVIAINYAIIRKWPNSKDSYAGLTRVKTMAWKLVEKGAAP